MTDEELKELIEGSTARLAERLDAQGAKIDAQGARLEETIRTLGRVEDTVNAQGARLDEQGASLHAQGERITGLEKKLDRHAADLRHQFDMAVESIRHEVRLIAEKVIGVDQRVTRETGEIRAAHEQLEGRVTILEAKKGSRR